MFHFFNTVYYFQKGKEKHELTQ